MSSRNPSSGSPRSNTRPKNGTEDFWKTVLDGSKASGNEPVPKPQKKPPPPPPSDRQRTEQRAGSFTGQAQGSGTVPLQHGGRHAPPQLPPSPTAHLSSGQGGASHSSYVQTGAKGTSSQRLSKHQLGQSTLSPTLTRKRFTCPECWKEFERLGHLTDHGRSKSHSA